MAVTKRLQVKVTGVVQGVGFRPFIYRLARAERLSGWVRNDAEGVFMEIEGQSTRIDNFLSGVVDKCPPLARIEKLDTLETRLKGDMNFVIEETVQAMDKNTLVAPDVAVCDDCLNEMFNPDDRRYRYPFINCTNCGPRFTIINDIPYDRVNTTMDSFPMCPKCREEYKDPENRRFHAEPNACPDCGPKVYLQDNYGRELTGDPVAQAVKLLKEGAILAVKGLGGYHLACDATNNTAVDRLRAVKHREEKPFAIMSGDIDEIKKFCRVSTEEEKCLKDNRRPIVLLKKKAEEDLIAKGVAPGNNSYGVMLPYTPLHYLILAEITLGLVMTSGNHSSEPIIFRDDDALERLKDIADYFLIHNREIYQRCDDSVARVFQGREMVIRRSRGYAPGPVKLPFRAKEILACGGELKNTFCLLKEDKAFISHHIGDLKSPVSLQAFEEGIEHYEKIFAIKPVIIAHDLHEDYLSTRYATAQARAILCGVQHHHAHIASCMAENGLTEPVIGLSFDGTGLGTDGAIWGGEFLVCDYRDFERVGHLKYVPMASGEMAIKEPWRMAAVHLKKVYGDDFTELPIPFTKELNKKTWRLLNSSLTKGINAPLTSSMGRLFDAVSALLGICREISYEGQAAIELEQMACATVKGTYQYFLDSEDNKITVDTQPLIRDIVNELRAGIGVAKIAGRFHNTVADLALKMCKIIGEQKGINKVALSGGVFQNILLLHKITEGLSNEGFEVFTHSQVPTNDGGISLGQAVIAHERSKLHVLSGTGKSN